MKTLLIIFWLIVPVLQAYGQYGLTLELETDKESYAYGDTIEVRFTATNASDDIIVIIASSSCLAWVTINDIGFPRWCAQDLYPHTFTPEQKHTWTWSLIPSVQGIPNKDGKQNIAAFLRGRINNELVRIGDTITVKAPIFYGGVVSVGYTNDNSDEIAGIRESINADILYSSSNYGEVSQSWQINGHSIDSLVAVYNNDERFKWIVVERAYPASKRVTSPRDQNIYLGYPQHKATEIPLNPRFRWFPPKGLARFNFQLAKDSSFTQLIIEQDGITHNSFQPKETLKSNMQYFWRVRGIYYDFETNWSEAYELTTTTATQQE